MVTLGVAVAVGLGPGPLNGGVAVVAAEQLWHRHHAHVLLQPEICIDDPGEFSADIEDNLGLSVLQAGRAAAAGPAVGAGGEGAAATASQPVKSPAAVLSGAVHHHRGYIALHSLFQDV